MRSGSDENEADFIARLIDENEQLRTTVETLLEENGLLVEHRDRLSTRLAHLSHVMRASPASSELQPQRRPPTPPAEEAKPLAEEQLRVAFEEMQVLTEELEASNAALLRSNRELDARVMERTRAMAQAEVALKASEAAFQTVADLVPDLLWGADASGRAVWFNRRWQDETGQTKEEAQGEGWLSAVHPADQARCREAWRRAVETGSDFEHEHRILCRQEYHWVLARAEPIQDEQGRVLRWYGAMTDIDEQRRALEALKRSELRFRTLVEGMPPLVWRAVDGGAWTWASPQWQVFTGLSAEESVAMGWLDALHPDDRQAAREAWAEAQARGALVFEARLLDAAHGQYRHFHTRAAPVLDEAGRPVEWLGVSSDVHEEVELRERQAVLMAELQHRTRNIMAVVRSVTRQTLERSDSLEAFEGAIEHRLAALARVQGLLSRAAEGPRVTFDELLKEELEAQAPGVGDQGERICLEGPPGIELRSATVQTLALGLHELITNAVKYGALGRPDGRLSIRWGLVGRGEQSRLKVEWKETGAAEMPEADAPPMGGGYGLELIQQALPYQLGAKTSFAFEEDGVSCTIELPVPAPRADVGRNSGA